MARWQPAVVAVLTGGAFAALTALVDAEPAALGAVDEAIGAGAYRIAQRHRRLPVTAARLTGLGRAPVVLGVLAGVIAATGGRWSTRTVGLTKGHRLPYAGTPLAGRGRPAVFAGTATAVSALLGELVRARTARRRPPGQLCPVDGAAFPSGHTTRATAGALTVVLLARPVLPPAGRVALVGLASCWPAAVGVSRVLLCAHWPSDVLGGWLVGVTGVCATAAVLAPWPRYASCHDGPYRRT